MNKDDKKEIIYKVQKYNSGTLGAGPEYPSEHVYRNMGTTGTSGFTATSRATTPFHAYGILLLGPLVPRPTAPQPLIDHQPTNLNLSNILSIKSKREGSLRGGDEKVFVFYSGTIFFPPKSILTPRGVGLELQTDLDTPNLMHLQTSLLYPFLHILSIKSNSGGFPKGGHRFPLCFHKGIGTAK